jgi:DNA polymerase-3 subunit delta
MTTNTQTENTAATPPLLPVYLFLGDDELKKETLYARLLKRLEAKGDMVFNSQVFDATQPISAPELLDALNTMPFASPIRLVSVKDVDKAQKAVSDAIIDYLSEPLESSILVLSATKLKSDSRLLKAVRAVSPKAIISSESKKRGELPGMVMQMAKGYKITMTNTAAQELIELVGNSTVAINTELQKLAAYLRSLGKNTADKSDISAVVARATEASPWDFVEAFSKRDLALSLELLGRMRGESPINLLALCVIRIRDLLLLKSYAGRGQANLASAMGRQDWQVKRLQASARLFTPKELRKLLALAADIDMRMKSGKNPEQQLIEFLLAART